MKRQTNATMPLKPGELEQIDRVAAERRASRSAVLYAILHQATQGFTNFSALPDEMPRSYYVRVKKEVAKNDTVATFRARD
jgi:hypothetical protein